MQVTCVAPTVHVYCSTSITKTSSPFIYWTLGTGVLPEALPPVCMKYTAQDESRVVNIAQGEAECYICHKTALIKSCIPSYKQSGSVLCLLY